MKVIRHFVLELLTRSRGPPPSIYLARYKLILQNKRAAQACTSFSQYFKIFPTWGDKKSMAAFAEQMRAIQYEEKTY